MIVKCYPGGKKKAFNISYDDGIEQDIRFVALLNRYGLKGTFNLNSGLMQQEFAWTHECGLQIRRLPESAVRKLYRGNEVASHTFSHPYMDAFSREDILKELASDRFFLERLFEREVVGYATPFYFYSDLLADCVRKCGFAYGRISEKSDDYTVPSDFYRWRGSKFHWDTDLEEFVDNFLHTEQELALCQLIGHSYDLDVLDLWDRMESICRKISESEDVWPATHIELVRYLRALEMVSVEPDRITNNSNRDVWFLVHGNTIVLHPGEEILL